MIVKEPYGKFDFVYSDKKCIMRRDDGEEMAEDLIIPGTHTYEETDRKRGEKPIDENEQALKILLGMEA